MDSLDAVVDVRGKTRARFLVMKLLERARELQVGFPATVSSDYINSIPPEREPWFPGDETMERRIRAFVRWNAAVMVTRANAKAPGIGGHLATYASSRRPLRGGLQPLLPGQGRRPARRPGLLPGPRRPRHLRPGLPRRPTHRDPARQLPPGDRRQRALQLPPPPPHARLLGVPHRLAWASAPSTPSTRPVSTATWPTGASPTPAASRVWAFLGDGECDEPESLGALSLAARESLDNLTFVVNCNLQRLDGPVRGNGKIIQELEAVFRGAGGTSSRSSGARSGTSCSPETSTASSSTR